MHRLWLIFAQAATVCVAALFVVATFKPQWLGRTPGVLLPEVGWRQTLTIYGVVAGVLLLGVCEAQTGGRFLVTVQD